MDQMDGFGCHCHDDHLQTDVIKREELMESLTPVGSPDASTQAQNPHYGHLLPQGTSHLEYAWYKLCLSFLIR